MTRDIGGQTMVKCGVNLSRDAAVGEQFWQTEVVCDDPPLHETGVREEGMGRGDAIALLVRISLAIVDGLCVWSVKNIRSLCHRPHVGIRG